MPVLRSMSPPCGPPTHPALRRECRLAAAPCSLRPAMPPDGLPMGSGNGISAGEGWRYPGHRTCTHLALKSMASAICLLVMRWPALHPAPAPGTPMTSAICLLVILPSAFRRTIQAAFDSSSFAMARTFQPPNCRHFCRAWEMPPHTAMSALGISSPAARREGGRRRPSRSPLAYSHPLAAGRP